MRFKVKIDAEFIADDIDDAIQKLGQHFLDEYTAMQAEDEEASQFFISGEANIEPS